jgi:hypothetical protein
MSAEISSVVLLGFNGTDSWGSIQRRPSRALYIIHYGAPMICDEAHTFEGAEVSEHCMLLRWDDSGFAHDVAYFALKSSPFFIENPDKADRLPDNSFWTHDPRDDAEDFRSQHHDAIAELMTEANLRLQVVRFSHMDFADERVELLANMGCAVDVFDMTRDDQSTPVWKS